MKKQLTALLLPALLIAAGLSACTRTITNTYYRPADAVIDQVFVKPDADFGKYSKLLNGGLEIYYPEEGAQPPAADLERIRATFRAAFLDALDDTYVMVTEPGPDVLQVRAQIIDMKITGRDGSYTPRGRLRDVVARGELTFLMEMADSVSGDVLARAADRTQDTGAPDESADWDDIDAAARHWAELFRGWLDRSLDR